MRPKRPVSLLVAHLRKQRDKLILCLQICALAMIFLYPRTPASSVFNSSRTLAVNESFFNPLIIPATWSIFFSTPLVHLLCRSSTSLVHLLLSFLPPLVNLLCFFVYPAVVKLHPTSTRRQDLLWLFSTPVVVAAAFFVFLLNFSRRLLGTLGSCRPCFCRGEHHMAPVT